MRHGLLALLVLLALGGLTPLSGEEPAPAPKALPASFEQREKAALEFVRAHHPELAILLEQLKPARPDEYRRAVGELAQVSRNLANLKLNDERRYAAHLETWKARSEVQLLAAKLVSTPSADLEKRLRAAIECQIGAEVKQQRVEREVIRERLRKVGDEIERLEKDRDKIIESRFQGLLKKGQRARRPSEGKPAPAGPPPASGESQK